jgi:glycosyltransferase involved in cell wall biosynthesis
MNILFIGPYRQNDGWGLAAQSYIKALGTTGHNITTRPVFLAGADTGLDDSEILEYENSFYDSYDMVIQKTLPHCLFLNRKFKKNIGLFTLETNDISNSVAVHSINSMDEVWVPSEQEKKCLLKSGINKPIKVISQPIDTNFIKENINHKLDLHPLVKKTFKFYFIGEYIERKNIKDLITAFHMAFSIDQQVSLIIKTGVSGRSPQESKEIIEKDIQDIKKKLNISGKYKKEIVITDRLSYQDVIGLHNACDCFVSSSYGESVCRPAAEALCLGKMPIVTDNTGMTDFINKDNGFIVQSHRTPVLLNQRTLSNDFDMQNANEYWYKISIYDLIEKMRLAYTMYKQDRKAFESKQQTGIDSIEQFSYSSIGNKLCI